MVGSPWLQEGHQWSLLLRAFALVLSDRIPNKWSCHCNLTGSSHVKGARCMTQSSTRLELSRHSHAGNRSESGVIDMKIKHIYVLHNACRGAFQTCAGGLFLLGDSFCWLFAQGHLGIPQVHNTCLSTCA